MPSKSLSQQRLFCMAYAVRKGKMKRSEVSQSVLDIADGDMTDNQIKDFMVREQCSLKDFLITEMLFDDHIFKDAPAGGNRIKNTPTKYASGDVYEPESPLPNEVFIVVKPGFINKAQDIIKIFEDNGFDLYKTKVKKLLLKEAQGMYYMHKGEDFYDALCKYMSSDITMGIMFTTILKKDLAFKKVDRLKDQIREKWSESDMRNVMHSSDSLENMKKESEFYF